MLPQFIEAAGAAVGKALGLTTVDTHDAATPPQDTRSPSYAQARAAAPSKSHPRKSEDELRLVGDFSTPADAVACPDPQIWDTGVQMAAKPTLKKTKACSDAAHTNGQTADLRQPGARGSFNPIDTLMEDRTGNARSRQITYGKQDRLQQQSIGRTQYGGQQAFLQAMASRSPATSVRTRGLHVANTDDATGPSPSKRRKTEHTVILDDDDDPQYVSPSRAPWTPVSTARGRRPSASRSQSQVSIGSGTSFTTARPNSTSQSEFLLTDQRLSHHRKRRRPNPAREEGLFPVNNAVVTSPNESSLQSPYVVSDDDEAPPRQHLLKNFKQGVGDSPQGQVIVTSIHFPGARINESTSETSERLSNARKGTQSTNLRDTYRRPPPVTEDVDDSLDEVATSPAGARPGKAQAAPSKVVQAANSEIKRKKRTVASEEIVWQLKFARSHDFEQTSRGLRLKRDTDKKFIIQAIDDDHNYCHIGDLDFARVARVLADTISHIRFTSSRSSDGNVNILDLEFADNSEFLDFRDNYVEPHSGVKKIVSGDEAYMGKIFAKDLPKNHRVGQVLGDDVDERADTSMATQTRQASGQGDLFKQLRAHAPEEKKAILRPTRTTARPTRSTAASSRLFDVSPVQDTVEKFSEVKGLGRPWKRPLVYVQGKQRATVHFEDLYRLDEEEFLNDSLIDFYMIHLFKQHNVPTDKVYFFNTFFYTALTSDAGRNPMNYAKVARWTQKIDIFGYDYIVVPINESTHWYLAIICNVSGIDRKPVIEDFDEDSNPAAEEQGSTPLVGDHQHDSEAAAKHPLPSSNNPRLGVDRSRPIVHKGEDDSLLEESKQLDLVDPHDPGSQEDFSPANGDSTEAPADGTVADGSTSQDIFAPVVEIQKSLDIPLATQKSKKPKKRQQALPKRDPDQPVIIILDSLGDLSSRYSAVRTLKAWIAAEGKAKRGMDAIIKENGYYPKASQIPKQSNWSDCGVYLLGYVEKFFQSPDDFKNRLLTGEMFAQIDWPDFDPRQMRTQMRNIIVQCVKDQDAAKAQEKKAKLEASKVSVLPSSMTEQKQTQDEPLPPEANDQSSVAGAGAGILLEAHEPSIAKTPTRRLNSPFEFKPRSARSNGQAPNTKADNKVPTPRAPDSVNNAALLSEPSVKPAFATPMKEERRRSPEVRIPSKSPEKSRAAQVKAPSSPPSADETQRQHRLEEWQQNKIKVERVASKQKRSPGSPSQKEGTSRTAQPSPPTKNDREGSAPDIPIEIPESQEPAPEPTASPKRTMTKPPAKRRRAAESSPGKHLLKAAPSLEEIDVSVFQNNSVKKQQRNAAVTAEPIAEVQGEESQSRGATPMLMDGSLQRDEGAPFELMDIDSSGADAMDVDTKSLSSVVQETPEPDEADDGQFPSGGRNSTPLLM
ncbi:hypothetical protein NX059_009990 [Plenodomus lindquistii]|nr:hypothetical protein NX059_009990 [Plenodomus lindquistii]